MDMEDHVSTPIQSGPSSKVRIEWGNSGLAEIRDQPDLKENGPEYESILKMEPAKRGPFGAMLAPA